MVYKYILNEVKDRIGILTLNRLDKMNGVGNAAGYGACLALLDRNKRKEAERIAKKMVYRELAATNRFQELFVPGMFFTSARDFEDTF